MFKASSEHSCTKCGEIIKAGDFCTWNRRSQPVEYFHPACAEVKAPSVTTKGAPVKTRTKVNRPLENANPEGALSLLMQGLMSQISQKAIQEAVRSEIDGRIGSRIVVETKEAVLKIDSAHKDLKKLIYIIGRGDNAYLWGPPGSGKSTAAKQSSEAMGWDYGYISLNPQTPDSRLLGFLDATGTYRPTLFRKIYEHGGVFCIDELDNAAPSLLTTLNSCLENGHAAFPDGLVAKNKNFVLVGTGNTPGYGGNPAFPERRPFDAAFAERFTFLFWDYDEKLENAIALSINADASEWIGWIKKARKWAVANFPRLVISPRATFKIAEYIKSKELSTDEILESVLFKGISADVKTKLLGAVPVPAGVN